MTSWTEITGWTLLHFVWQGALIALAAGSALHLMRHRSPHARYLMACAGLALMLASPLITARYLASPAPNAQVSHINAPPAAGSQVGDRPAVLEGDASSVALNSVTSAQTFALSRTLASVGVDVTALLSTIVALWLGGVAVLFLHMAGGYRRVRQLHRVAMLEETSRWSQSGRRIAARLGLSRIVHIVDSAAVDTPTVIGWMRPVILLPVAAVSNLSPSQVEAILAHELAHIRRYDFVVNVFQTLAETLLFYHPGVWWVSRRIRTERENCCDDIAVAVCGDPYVYAAALTEIAANSLSATSLAVTATGGSLLTRVRRLLGVKTDGNSHATSALVVIGIALTLAVAGGSLRLFSMTQSTPSSGDTRRFGPPDLARLLGVELPGPPHYPTDDPRGIHAWGARIHYPGGEMALIGFTARALIRDTYDLVDVPIDGAPDWMDHETFDVAIPSDVPVAADGISDPDLVRAALRRYFENDLHLSWHYETREFPVYALVRAHGDRLGPNIRPTADTCLDSEKLRGRRINGVIPRGQSATFCGVDNDLFGITGEKVTMDEFAREMKRHMSPLSIGREVVDRTGLTGAYDFELRIGLLPLAAVAHRSPAMATLLYPAGVRSIFTAFPQQLGVALEESTDARQVLVIDHIDRPLRTP